MGGLKTDQARRMKDPGARQGRRQPLFREGRRERAPSSLFIGRHNRIDAPCVIDGPMTGELFRAYVEQFLADADPGDIVVMDNLPAHKVKGIAEAITARGAEL